MEKKRIIGFYNYTVVLTYLGMAIAFTGICFAIHEKFHYSLLCLMLAGICDMFDGPISRTKERNEYEKHFGIQIDSLCDLVSFGILPGILVYMMSGGMLIAGIVSFIFALCALIRLAYYNVQEYERQHSTTGRRTSYLGLPVTMISYFLPFVYLINEFFSLNCPLLLTGLLAVVSAGFVAGVEIRKPCGAKKLITVIIGLSELGAVVYLVAGAIVAGV